MANTVSGQRRAPSVDFSYFKPAGRRPTQYEEVTLHTQWSPKNFATQGWFSPSSSGRPMWSEDSTLLRANDWWAYRDPGQVWFRPYVELQAAQEEAIELAVEGAKQSGVFSEFTPAWLEILSHYLCCLPLCRVWSFPVLLLCAARGALGRGCNAAGLRRAGQGSPRAGDRALLHGSR